MGLAKRWDDEKLETMARPHTDGERKKEEWTEGRCLMGLGRKNMVINEINKMQTAAKVVARLLKVLTDSLGEEARKGRREKRKKER